jgi:hypothetical protein
VARFLTVVWMVVTIPLGVALWVVERNTADSVDENRRIFLDFVADERCIDARFSAVIDGLPEPDCHTHHLRDGH